MALVEVQVVGLPLRCPCVSHVLLILSLAVVEVDVASLWWVEVMAVVVVVAVALAELVSSLWLLSLLILGALWVEVVIVVAVVVAVAVVRVGCSQWLLRLLTVVVLLVEVMAVVVVAVAVVDVQVVGLPLGCPFWLCVLLLGFLAVGEVDVASLALWGSMLSLWLMLVVVLLVEMVVVVVAVAVGEVVAIALVYPCCGSSPWLLAQSWHSRPSCIVAAN
jgi:hypothetical protein